MMGGFRQYYIRQQYLPGPAGIFLNPFYLARRELLREMERLAPRMQGVVLDVGCGTKPYCGLFTAATAYVGLEFDTPENRASKQADYFYDGEVFPFEKESFDGVVCSQVLEHVFNPDNFLQEVRRVMKPGGELLLTVPFLWDEHEQPRDYARYSSFGLRSLLEKNGFVLVEQRKTNADARALFQLINAFIYKVSHTSSAKVNLLFSVTIMATFNLLGILLGHILPGNPDLYLDQVVLARNKTE